MPRRRFVAVLCAFVLSTTLVAQGPPPRPVRPPIGCGTQSGSQVVSPVAMATWVARVQRDGARELDILVLWRGTASWFASGSGGGSGSSGGGDCRLYHTTISRGDVQLQLEFDSQTRLATITQALFRSPTGKATIQKRQIELRDRNVLLVDAVDDANGPQIVGTQRIEPVLPPGDSPAWVGEALRRSPEIVSFLRCDTRLDDPLKQKLGEIICASVLGQ